MTITKGRTYDGVTSGDLNMETKEGVAGRILTWPSRLYMP